VACDHLGLRKSQDANHESLRSHNSLFPAVPRTPTRANCERHNLIFVSIQFAFLCSGQLAAPRFPARMEVFAEYVHVRSLKASRIPSPTPFIENEGASAVASNSRHAYCAPPLALPRVI
jgi:hypothetical protein